MQNHPRDLSLASAPVSSLFEQPRSPDDWRAYELSAGALESFDARGFVTGVRILDGAQVDTLRDELARLVHPSHPGNSLFYEYHSNESVDPSQVLFHALGAWRPAFRMAAFQLLGGPVRQFHDQLFAKPAGDGGVVAWHQDYSYWTWTRPMAHLSCWIALDDATTENGCLWYVPGSHRWGLLPITGLTGDMNAIDRVLDDEQRKAFANRVAIELPKGHATFHHPLLIHGSYENRSPRPRRATVLNVVRDGVRSNPAALDPAKYAKLSFPILPQDEALGGRFYPLLFDPDRELGARRAAVPVIARAS